MKKIIICLALLVVMGCLSEQKLIPVNKQVCSNQQLWDNRNQYYKTFECDMYETDKGTVRVCTATNITLHENWNITLEEMTTTCLQVCIKNCE